MMLSFGWEKASILSNLISSIQNNKLKSLNMIMDATVKMKQGAFVQMQRTTNSMASTTLSEDKDVWGYRWGSNIFSSTKVYKILMGHSWVVDPAFKWIWKSFCQPKHKVFFWLLTKDRLSTRNILRRNMTLDCYNCVLCNLNEEETVQHLFPHCPFAWACWGLLQLDVPLDSSFPEIVTFFKVNLQTEFFMIAVILMCWVIWTASNLIFGRIQPNVQICRALFLKEVL